MRWHIALAAVLTMVVAAALPLAANDWPEWRGAGRLGVWTENGILDEFPAGGLTAAWRVPIGGGYAGPSVADGRVFVTDARRADPRSTAVVERLLALDEATGEVLWTREWDTNYAGLQLIYATGPRATPTVDGDRVYAVGATGNLLALDVADGSVLWRTDYVRDFNAAIPSWGISGAPLVDGDRLISLVGGEPDAKVVAFDKRTGEVLWQALSSDWEPGYTAPVLIDAAGTRQLIVWHPRAISSLDPETGAVYWEVPHIVDMGMTISTVVQSGPYLLVTSQWGGAVMLRLAESHPDAALVWEGVGQSDPEYGPRLRHDRLGDGHARHRRRLRVRGRRPRRAPLPGTADGPARLGDRRPHRRPRQPRHGVHRAARGPLLHQYRRGRAGDRAALPGGLRRDQPHAPDRPDQPGHAAPPAGAGSRRALVAPSLCEPSRHHAQR